jgi:hypothetical protein
MYQMRDIHIDNALTAKIENENLAEICHIKYELYAWDSDSDVNDYVEIYDWIEKLMGIAMDDVDHMQFMTWFDFNPENAMINGEIWNKDIEAMLTRFTVNDKIVLKFELRARIPGSDSMGINADLSAIIKTQFEVHITDSSTAATCADNKFKLADNSYLYMD